MKKKVGPKFFKAKTILNADNVSITSDKKSIRVSKVVSYPVFDKNKVLVSYVTKETRKFYPNTASNNKKAKNLYGTIMIDS